MKTFNSSQLIKICFLRILVLLPIIYLPLELWGQITTTWKGVSSDWNSIKNWSDGALPNTNKNVIIPSGCKNYPIVNETASCNELKVLNGGSLTITKGAILTISKTLSVGTGLSGKFKILNGRCIVGENFYTSAGSKIIIAGGYFSFDNWQKNSTDLYAMGKITILGGTINAKRRAWFSVHNVVGKMKGPFTFNIGQSICNSDSVWKVSNGTIYLKGRITDDEFENEAAIICSNNTTSAIAYKLICSSETKSYLISSKNLIVKKDLIIAGYTRLQVDSNLIIKRNLIINDGGFLRDIRNCRTYIYNNLIVKGDGILDKLYSVNLKGNWINQGNNIAWASTVIFSGGNQTISGNSFFGSLTKVVGSKLTFSPGNENKTEVGSLTLKGNSHRRLALRSTVNGSQWVIDPGINVNICYLDVKDSKNIGPNPINACGQINSGNNTNWNFSCIIPRDINTLDTAATIKKSGSNEIEDISAPNSEKSLADNVSAYPNPTNGIIEIEIQNPDHGNYLIEIYNSTASHLKTYNKPQDESIVKIDLSYYPSGVYFVKIVNGEKTHTIRVLKN